MHQTKCFERKVSDVVQPSLCTVCSGWTHTTQQSSPCLPSPASPTPMTYQPQASQWASSMKQVMRSERMTALYWESRSIFWRNLDNRTFMVLDFFVTNKF